LANCEAHEGNAIQSVTYNITIRQQTW